MFLNSQFSRLGSRQSFAIAIGIFFFKLGAIGAEDVRLRNYVVQEGDSCVVIAARELGDRKQYKAIHKHNPSMGKPPHRLEPGSILKLPLGSNPDAIVTEKSGEVRVQEVASKELGVASKGTELFRDWRVISRLRSSAELTFENDSVLRMREKTVVIVHGPSAEKAKVAGSRAFLKEGTLRTRLSELDGKKLIVETESSEAVFGKGSGLISVSKAKSLVSNHAGGEVAVTASSKKEKKRKRKKKRPVLVKEGFGSKVEKGQEPSPPIPLPDAPLWKQKKTVAIAIDGPAEFVAAFEPVEKAVSYRLEVFSKKGVLVASHTFGREIEKIVARGFPKGEYFAVLATVDGEGFESKPSARSLWVAVGATIKGNYSSGAQRTDSDGLIDITSECCETKALEGQRFVSPKGFECRVSNENSKSLAPGEQAMVCIDAEGNESIPFVVRVEPNPEPSAKKRSPPWLMASFHMGGVFVSNGDIEDSLGNPVSLSSGPVGGGTLGARISGPLWGLIEVEGGRVAFSGSSAGVNRWSVRGMARYSFLDTKSFSLNARLGLGMQNYLIAGSDLDPIAVAGIETEFGPWSGVALHLRATSDLRFRGSLQGASTISAGLTVYPGF